MSSVRRLAWNASNRPLASVWSPVCVATVSPIIVVSRGDIEDRDVHVTRIGRVAGGLAAEEIDRRLVVIGLEERAQTTHNRIIRHSSDYRVVVAARTL